MKAAMVLLAVLMLASASACTGDEIVWQNDVVGARITGCRTSDCGPLFAAARVALDRMRPNHAEITQQRIGESVCKPDGQACHGGGLPVGASASLPVVFDFRSGPHAVVQVLCSLTPDSEVAERWNDMWCTGR